jgi:hypothetical protein
MVRNDEGCDVFRGKCEFFIVNTRKYNLLIVTTRSCTIFFRNYGSQSDRSYGVATPQFDRNRTHGIEPTYLGIFQIQHSMQMILER